MHRPDVKLVLCELTPQDQIQQLLDYQIDVGFAFLPYEHHPDLESMTILSESLVVALPEFYPLVDPTFRTSICSMSSSTTILGRFGFDLNINT